MNTTDRYAKIREALEMRPTPGPFSASRSYSPGNQELILLLTYKDEHGITENYCTVRNRLGDTWKTEANAAYIAACDPDTIRELLAERDALAAENERLKEDRARFPDRPDDIGRMIEAHIGNLKEGKKIADALANRAFDRACRAEAALAKRDKEIVALGEALHVALGALRKIADTDLLGCADMTTAEIFGALSRMHETAAQALRRASREGRDD